MSGAVFGLNRISVTGVLQVGQHMFGFFKDSAVQLPQRVCLQPNARTVWGEMSSIQMGHVGSTK